MGKRKSVIAEFHNPYRKKIFNLNDNLCRCFLILILTTTSLCYGKTVVLGNEQTALYVPLLKGKRVGLVINHTSFIKSTPLLDSLIHRGINVTTIFSPEHGFSGQVDAGKSINSSVDKHTNIPIISLYGKHKKPSPKQINNIDILVFDIQDVGVRFYTYISTLHLVMESCAEENKPLIILDRTNPNGHYVDGPVLDTAFSSFIGMHPIPIVYGMTIGELGKMINQEGWLKHNITCSLTIIPLKNYTHHTYYPLSIAPSPNLRSMTSILLYPSLCLLEGSVVSVGRGTHAPFEMYGHPLFPKTNFSFIPKSGIGSKAPKHQGRICYGYNLNNNDISTLIDNHNYINLSYLIQSYKYLNNKRGFFNASFNLLSGNKSLKNKIKKGISKEDIKNSWKKDIDAFLKVRKKYLLYP